MSLLDLVKNQISGVVSSQLAKYLGINEGLVKTGLAAILPTLLAGLMKTASTPAGAESLNNTLDQGDYDGGIFSKLPDLLGGDSAESITGAGSDLLSGLLGDKLGPILEMISKFTGIGSDKSSTLMSLATSLLMSLLGQQKKSLGLDSIGLSSLLMSQKESVAEALPPGMASTMGLADLGITDSMSAAKPAATSTQPVAAGGLGPLYWIVPVALVALLGWFGYSMFFGKPSAAGLNDAAGAIAGLDQAGMTSKLTEMFEGYQQTLSGITDEASAKFAIPKIEDMNSNLAGMSGVFEKLPESARSAISSGLAAPLEAIKAVIEKLYAIPGVQAILQPTIDSMLEKAKPFIG